MVTGYGINRKTRHDGLIIFCPVETKAREMDAKMLLACVAAERGHTCIIGDMAELRSVIEFLPRGVYLSKSIPDKMEKHFRRYKELGYGVVAWCEEGLVFPSREVYARKMVSEGTLKYTDLFFAWGENQYQAILSKVPEYNGKVHKVGNPRIDVLRKPFSGIYRAEAESLRDKYGDYILFNTNFAIANNVLGTDGAYESAKKRGKVKTREAEDYYWEYYEHRKELFECTVKLVKAVSESFPGRRIVVRPHPSENHETWRSKTAAVRNVYVVFEGSAVPWIVGSDVLVHSGCTTAVEAYFLGTPSISFRPVKKEGYELELPNDVSLHAESIEQVIELVDSVSHRGKGYNRWQAEAGGNVAGYLANFDDQFASDVIVGELEQYYGDHPIEPEAQIRRLSRLWQSRARKWLRVLKYGRKALEDPRIRPGRNYRRQKFPDVTLQEMEELVRGLSRESGRFSGVRVSPLKGANRCFKVETERGSSH